MLKPPKKNFGWMPSGEFLAHGFIMIFLCLIPLIFTIVQMMMGNIVGTGSVAGFVPRIVFLGLYAWFIHAVPGGIKTIYDISKRRRYVRQVVRPYFKRKYGIKLFTGGDRLDPVFTGEPLKMKGKYSREEFYVFGWEYVEDTAAGNIPEEPLENHLYVVEISDHGTAVEIPLKNGSDDERMTFTAHPNGVHVPDLNDTEEGIKTMLAKILHSLPEGETLLRGIAPAASEMGVSSDMEIIVQSGDRILYSIAELKSLAETLLFNVRLTEAAMVIVLIEAVNGNKYVCGHIVSNTGYSDVPIETMKEILDEAEIPGFIYVKNAGEIK